MQLFSADTTMKKNLKKKYFAHEKLKQPPKKLLIIGPNPFIPQPRATAHSPKMIFNTMKSRDPTSVLLSVVYDFTYQDECNVHVKIVDL
jgi:hypothetical protein